MSAVRMTHKSVDIVKNTDNVDIVDIVDKLTKFISGLDMEICLRCLRGGVQKRRHFLEWLTS
jgi:hypothetical protein